MHFTLKQLQIFIAVVNQGSTLAAAHTLDISQPAISSAITELETNLNTKLFDRWRKRIRLNERGRSLVPLAQLLLANAREIEMTFDNETNMTGATLHIGASMTLSGYIMPSVITSFISKYPTTKIELVSSNRTNIISKVEDCSLDIGIIAGECHTPYIRNLFCLTDELCIFTNSNNPLAKNDTISTSDLMNANWVMRESGSGTLEKFLNSLPAEVSNLKTMIECDNLESIKKTVESSNAIGCISINAIRHEVEQGRFKILSTPFINLKRDCYTIMHQQRSESFLLNAFHKHFTDMMA